MRLSVLAFAGMALAGAILPTASKSDVGTKTSDSAAPTTTRGWGLDTNWTELFLEWIGFKEKPKKGGKASPSDA
ncbi:hypothetical protein FNYG_15048 [Fusarium nygamai]|uniref:Uncharacterized protein n=1 Tax=Gibberella nygamai TaxID=42673 RepID=A0A2K0UKV0_GIBNY|nr:hypothetical protein FNYG_15048 [Fusarium nygamai]